MPTRVLITGGSGLVGTRLSEKLREKGYIVYIYSREKYISNKVTIYKWDVDKKEIEIQALKNCDYIIHLAGANIFDHKWSEKRKNEILNSRVEPVKLLIDNLKQINHKVKAFISASGINIYGINTRDKLITEDSGYANNFLSQVTQEWERAADLFDQLDIRVVKLRTGPVLSSNGGMLPPIARMARWWLASPIGTGKQYLSWIHIDDLCDMYIKSIEDESMQGVFNAVAPKPVTNKYFTYKVCKTLKKPFFMPNVPPIILKLLYGERAGLLLGGLKVSSEKIQNSGFHFQYDKVEKAFEDLLIEKKEEKYERVI